jgi:hypothetical protein
MRCSTPVDTTLVTRTFIVDPQTARTVITLRVVLLIITLKVVR